MISISVRHPRCRVALLTTLLAISSAVAPGTGFAVEPPPGGWYPNAVTALGQDALFNDSPGADNTGIGFQALYNATTAGAANTAVGSMALHNNTTGYSNVAVGFQPLAGNTTGTFNIAIGPNALIANTTGSLNVAIGKEALQAHKTPFDNVAIGSGAMALGTKGEYNVAVGDTAMAFANGNDNVALGAGAMNSANGNFNVAIGSFAGLYFAGNSNIALGYQAGQNVTGKGANNIEIANQGQASDAGVIRLGTEGSQKTTFVAGIRSTPLASGVAVGISPDGQLGVRASSARFKEEVQPMDKASEVLLALKPVTFHYKKEFDPAAIPQFGLVAEEVAKVDPDLVARDESGKPYTVRYDEVNAMLLNEFLKEHRKVEEEAHLNATQSATITAQQGEIGELKAALAEMKAALEAQAAQIQKVSAEVKASDGNPRLVSMSH